MAKVMTSGGEALIKALADENVDIIFGYPGGAALHIYDAIYQQDRVQHILVRHEQAATHAADGFARATGKPGVCLVTSGPGATNAITGIATAYMDSIPLVVISGQVANHLIGTDAFQETDMMGISRPIVKHSFLVQKPEEIPVIVKKAFHIATSGRPGPVVIDVPKNLTDPNEKFEYKFPSDLYLRSFALYDEAENSEVKKAVKLLTEAERPVIYAGGGAINSNAAEEIYEFGKLMGCPVTNTLMGLGVYPASDEQFVGMLGMHGTYEANMVMHEADLIMAIGARFDDRITNNPNKFGLQAKKIHIDSDPSSIDKIIDVDVAMTGNAKKVISQINKELKAMNFDNKKFDGWMKKPCSGVLNMDSTIICWIKKIRETSFCPNKLFSPLTKRQMVRPLLLRMLVSIKCSRHSIIISMNPGNGLIQVDWEPWVLVCLLQWELNLLFLMKQLLALLEKAAFKCVSKNYLRADNMVCPSRLSISTTERLGW